MPAVGSDVLAKEADDGGLIEHWLVKLVLLSKPELEGADTEDEGGTE